MKSTFTKIELIVSDDDVPTELSDATLADIEDNSSAAIIGFEFNEDYSEQKLIYIKDVLSSKLEKEIIDGKYKKALEDAVVSFKLLANNVKVKRFYLSGDPSSGLGGYVYNASKTGKDEWTMLMNLGLGFVSIADQGATTEYNETGVYGNIFTHELSHIATLNISGNQIIPNTTEEKTVIKIPIYFSMKDA